MDKKINIDRDKCVGCGMCQNACKEGVIGMVDGKAAVLNPNHCDGLGMCLPVCPVGAISFAGQGVRERNWPLQIKLAPIVSPYFNKTKLLIAADCTAFAYANFHREFAEGRTLLIGCPKLDEIDYSEKLAEIFKSNDIEEVIALRMEVPCCSFMVEAVKEALNKCGKKIKFKYHVITLDGKIAV